MNNAQRRQGTLTLQPRHGRQPQKAKPWSHQDDLLAMRGQKIVMTYLDGQRQLVKLLEADPFALKVENEEQAILIVWKHDLSNAGLFKQGDNA